MDKEIVVAEAVVLAMRLSRMKREGFDVLGVLVSVLLAASIVLNLLWREDDDE